MGNGEKEEEEEEEEEEETQVWWDPLVIKRRGRKFPFLEGFFLLKGERREKKPKLEREGFAKHRGLIIGCCCCCCCCCLPRRPLLPFSITESPLLTSVASSRAFFQVRGPGVPAAGVAARSAFQLLHAAWRHLVYLVPLDLPFFRALLSLFVFTTEIAPPLLPHLIADLLVSTLH